MTIDECRELKFEVEKKLYSLIKEFEDQTNCQVNDIYINHMETGCYKDNEPGLIICGVNMNIIL